MVNKCVVTKVICRYFARGQSFMRSIHILFCEMVSKVESKKVQKLCVGSFKPMKGEMKLLKGSPKCRHNLEQFDRGTHYIVAIAL